MLKETDKKHLSFLADLYPSKAAASAEIISLASELYLPKGTEHFLSDLHGEYEAFSHIRRSASGVIRRKLDILFGEVMTRQQLSELAAVVYYPEEKLAEKHSDKWYEKTIVSLLELLSSVSSKYTRKKVMSRLSLASEYKNVFYELLYTANDRDRTAQLSECAKTVVRIKESREFITALASSIKRLTVDRVHILGDIFDRGARPDKILDELMNENSVDIQWGNHDILWMGAASGSAVCIMGALFNSLTYKNLDFIEIGYGISLRPLAEYAKETYYQGDLSAYFPKGDEGGAAIMRDDNRLVAAMRKTVAILMWKLEGLLITRNPKFDMSDRLILNKISKGEIELNGTKYSLLDKDFPSFDSYSPTTFSQAESEVITYLVKAFTSSEKLYRHATFLCSVGSMYKVYNRNLLFHGCIPMTSEGDFLPLEAAEGKRGKALMDYCDKTVRDAVFTGNEQALDFMWFLWCGKNSPLSGRERITTFEHLLINDKATHNEPRNSYYEVWNSPVLAEKILYEFGLGGMRSHIINGHIPVNKGENPIKAGGKLILIDGGFCHAFIGRTGIAGYTLIYSSEGMRISAHEPFVGKEAAIKSNADIISDTAVFETLKKRIRLNETDEGQHIMDKIADLMMLREAYDSGEIAEKV